MYICEACGTDISIHALREEGDLRGKHLYQLRTQFLSTPSARRATHNAPKQEDKNHISIHALREEGDANKEGMKNDVVYFYPRPPRGGRPRAKRLSTSTPNFYPRPPRGGRLSVIRIGDIQLQFLSTPSARRATQSAIGGSTDALFLSTPSARRATQPHRLCAGTGGISIHALREEGDMPRGTTPAPPTNFYPRPPRGGRRRLLAVENGKRIFLSTPSARRATAFTVALLAEGVDRNW